MENRCSTTTEQSQYSTTTSNSRVEVLRIYDSRQKAWVKIRMTTIIKKFGWLSAVLVLSTVLLPTIADAQDRDEQDQQDDPPSRVARIGYMEGSVSFQPAGEPDWVQAVANRPMTTGD